MHTRYTLTATHLQMQCLRYDELTGTFHTDVEDIAFSQVHEYLDCAVDLQGVTVQTIFEVFAQNTVLQSIFRRRFIQDYLQIYAQWLTTPKSEKLPSPLSDGKNTDCEEPPIEQIVLGHSDAGTLYPANFFEEQTSKRAAGLRPKPRPVNNSRQVLFEETTSWELTPPTLGLTGRSAVLTQDIKGAFDEVLHPKGGRIDWSLSFVPLTEILDKPLVLASKPSEDSSADPVAGQLDKAPFAIRTEKNQFFHIDVTVDTWLTLWDILETVLSEVSFHGTEKDKMEELETLKQVSQSLGEFLEDDPSQPAVMLYSGLGWLSEPDEAEQTYCQQLREQMIANPQAWLTKVEFLKASQLNLAELARKEERGYLYDVRIRQSSQSTDTQSKEDTQAKAHSLCRYPAWQLNITDAEFFRRVRLKSGHLTDAAWHRFCTQAHGDLESLEVMCTGPTLPLMDEAAKKALLFQYQAELQKSEGR